MGFDHSAARTAMALAVALAVALLAGCTPEDSDVDNGGGNDARLMSDGAMPDAALPPADGTVPGPDGSAPGDGGRVDDMATDRDAGGDARVPEPEPEPDPEPNPEPEPEPQPEPEPDPEPNPEPEPDPEPNPEPEPEPEPDMAVEPDMMVDDRLFSFFVTSIDAIRTLSGSEDGFGGDLGGLAGADAICQLIAGGVGMGHKEWRAFLSVTAGPDGQPVHAIDRIGQGPWYDANGRLIANNIAGLLQSRPAGDPQTINDLPDEHGVPLSVLGDSHDILTGSNRQGRLNRPEAAATCNDWTSSSGLVGRNIVMCGHSWPRSNRMGREWIADHTARGCAAGINLVQNGPGVGDCVGCGGGYGAFYCFALTP